MAEKVRRSRQLWITVVLLVLVVFAIGLVLGNQWNSLESSDATKVLRQSELDGESFLVEQELFASFENNCGLAETRLGSLSGELWSLGKTLSGDAQNRLSATDYSFLKRKYHLMQIRTYVLEKQLRDSCGSKRNVVLYYFKQNDSKSALQGELLDELVGQYELDVFAIELNYSKELEFLEQYYAIRDAPTIIVNFKQVLPGPIAKEDIVPLFEHG